MKKIEWPEEEIIHIRNHTLLRDNGEIVCVYIKQMFSKQEMQDLALTLLDSQYWEWHDDKKHGPKYFYMTGRWTSTGHFRPNDKIYDAGMAGKAENRIPVLFALAERAGTILSRFFPKVAEVIKNLPEVKRKVYFWIFSYFHVSMWSFKTTC